MAILTTNIIGSSGENLVAMRLEKLGYFKVYFLGDKAPIEDFLVEINDENHPYPCLMQVKTTNDQNPYQKQGNINTPVPDEKMDKLLGRPVPTYVVGADLQDESIYIAPAFSKGTRYPSIPTRFKIDKNAKQSSINLKKLVDEIVKYWEDSNIKDYKSKFISTI